MNRKQRRTIESLAKGKGSELIKTMQKAEAALHAVDKSNLDKIPEVLTSLEEQTVRAGRLADALADDYETLCVEQAVLRELLKEVLGASYEESLAAARDRVQRARAAKAEAPEEDPNRKSV